MTNIHKLPTTRSLGSLFPERSSEAFKATNFGDPLLLRHESSWIDLQRSQPIDPLELIAYAKLGSTVGVSENSSTYNSPPVGWASSSPVSVYKPPICYANGTDNFEKVANAEQWNIDHITADIDASLTQAMRKVIFLRSGLEWLMHIELNFGGSPYIDPQLSFLYNSSTRGDLQGTIPVISFIHTTCTGVMVLNLTLKRPANFTMGLVTRVSGGDSNVFEMDCNVVP